MKVIHLFSLVNKQMGLNKWQNYKKRTIQYAEIKSALQNVFI